MRKTVFLSLACLIYLAVVPNSARAEYCQPDEEGNPIVINGCTPEPTQETTEPRQDQPATDSEPSFKELRKTAQTATTTRQEAEEAYEKEKALYEEALKLGLDEESLNLIKADLDARKKALNEAEARESEAWETAAEKDNEESYYTRERMNNEMRRKTEEAANQSISLPKMGITIGSDITTTDSLFANVIKFLSRAIGIVAVLSIMIGGVILTISSADEDLQTKAKNIILYSVLALVFVLAAYAIVTSLQQIIYSLGE